jgi:hypothetical protein
LPESGTYDLWVNFWAKPSADWRINAGLAGDEMHVFRGVGSQPVEEGAQGGAVDTTSSGGARLHRAYLGRVDVRANAAVDVFVDDYAFAVGPRAPRSGNDVRTWYDGVSYAAVKQE